MKFHSSLLNKSLSENFLKVSIQKITLPWEMRHWIIFFSLVIKQCENLLYVSKARQGFSFEWGHFTCGRSIGCESFKRLLSLISDSSYLTCKRVLKLIVCFSSLVRVQIKILWVVSYTFFSVAMHGFNEQPLVVFLKKHNLQLVCCNKSSNMGSILCISLSYLIF